MVSNKVEYKFIATGAEQVKEQFKSINNVMTSAKQQLATKNLQKQFETAGAKVGIDKRGQIFAKDLQNKNKSISLDEVSKRKAGELFKRQEQMRVGQLMANDAQSKYNKEMKDTDKWMKQNLNGSKALISTNKGLTRTNKQSAVGFRSVNEMLGSFDSRLARTKKGVQGLGGRFAMEFLGIMFAGMAVQRAMGGIMRASITTFTTIMQQSKIGGTAVQQLGIEFTFLKFTLGAAFDEMIQKSPILFDMIRWLQGIIANNPTKIAKSITNIAIAGAAFFVGGSVMLGLNSLSIFLTNMKKGEFGTTLSKVATGMNAIRLAAGIVGMTIKFTSSFINFTEKKILAGIADALSGAAFLSVMTGKGKLAGSLLIASIGFEIAAGLQGEQNFTDILKSIGESLILFGAVRGGPAAPWLITLGFVVMIFGKEGAIQKFADILNGMVKIWDDWVAAHPILSTILRWGTAGGLDVVRFSYKSTAEGLEQLAKVGPAMEKLAEAGKELPAIELDDTPMVDFETSVQDVIMAIENKGGLNDTVISATTLLNQTPENLGGTVNTLNDSVVTASGNIHNTNENLTTMTTTVIPSNIEQQSALTDATNATADAAERTARAFKDVNDEIDEFNEKEISSSNISSYLSSPS